MNFSTLDEVLEQVKPGEEMDARSVYRGLEQVTDGRHKRGVRYSVALICTLIRLGQIGGHDYSAGDCSVGAPASGVATHGVAGDTPVLSLRRHL